MTKKYLMYIDGEFVEGENKEYDEVFNPSTDELISKVPVATVNDVKKAIDAADAAQEAWEALPAVERGAYLRKISAKIRENAEELALVLSEEIGKTQELSTVEVNFTADYIDYMSEWARRYEGKLFKVIALMKISFYLKKQLGSRLEFYHGTSHSS